jgi:hypothetical protein
VSRAGSSNNLKRTQPLPISSFLLRFGVRVAKMHSSSAKVVTRFRRCKGFPSAREAEASVSRAL